MTTNAYERQEAKFAMVELTKANIGAANGYSIKVPRGSIVLSVVVLTTVAFNSATTTTVTVGDGTTTFANAVDVKTTGSETVANAPKYYPDGGTISVTAAETGAAATAGQAFVAVQYIQNGNFCSVQE